MPDDEAVHEGPWLLVMLRDELDAGRIGDLVEEIADLPGVVGVTRVDVGECL